MYGPCPHGSEVSVASVNCHCSATGSSRPAGASGWGALALASVARNGWLWRYLRGRLDPPADARDVSETSWTGWLIVKAGF